MAKSFAARVKDNIAAATVATTAMVGMAGCDNPAANNRPQPQQRQNANANAGPNMYDTLGQFTFIGQDGQPVNIPALRASLQNNQTTLSFGYATCQNYCPMINKALAAVGQANPSLTSIIVAANPEVDGVTPESRQAFMNRLRGDGVAHNVVILYPTENGVLSNKTAPMVAMRSGAITSSADPIDHSAKVSLQDRNGTRIADKQGTQSPSKFVEAWAPLMGNGVNR